MVSPIGADSECVFVDAHLTGYDRRRYCVNMDSMTERIRADLRAEMARRRIKQTDLAQELGISRAMLNAMLNGQRGQLAPTWQKLLDALGLELVVQSKADAPSAQRGR